MSLLLRRHQHLSGPFHPMYMLVLNRAVTAGYAMPSYPCMVLQNIMFVKLIDQGFAGVLDFLWVLADDSGSSDFGRIQWIVPSSGLTVGSPTYTAKKGWYGSATTGWSASTGPHWVIGDASLFFYSTVGGAVGALESVVSQNGANSQIITIRHRTNPRLDFILNGTVAGSQILSAAAAANNTYYSCDVDNNSNHTTTWVNNTKNLDIAGGAGGLPNSGTFTFNTTSPRITGIVGGGGSLYKALGGVAAHPALNVIIQEYMAAVQLLP